MRTTNYSVYTTRAGDTFDLLAIATYNEERMASHIIEANPMYAGTIVFEAGVKIKIPVIAKTKLPSTLPPWRR